MNSILEKGKFEKIDKALLKEGEDLLSKIARYAEKLNTTDMDTILNEIRDGKAAVVLGYSELNRLKHGLDAKHKKQYLEVKQCNFYNKVWSSTFNDTTLEKAEVFGASNVWIAMPVWKLDKIRFIVYGNHPDIEPLLKDKILGRKSGSRSTQSISINDYIKKYQFKIYVMHSSEKEDVLKEILDKHPRLSQYLSMDDIRVI
jgi:hypothetical protein